MKDTIVITNRNLVKGDYFEQIKKVVKWHPHAMIIREKELSEKDYEELAKKVLEICKKQQVTCYIHSDFEIAKKLKCHNIHIPITLISKLKKQEFNLISVSCHSLEDVKLAIKAGANQIVLGTIFETECKKGLAGKGLSFVKEICQYCQDKNVSVYAIGGITPQNLSEVKEAGAAGGCMMSYMMTLL